MKLMMVCPTCNGLGVESVDYFVNIEESKVCGTCHGKAVVEPSAQILDDLECAEIERELIAKFKDKAVFVYYEFGHWNVAIPYTGNYKKYFEALTKLEALRKAKDWMDGRDAE